MPSAVFPRETRGLVPGGEAVGMIREPIQSQALFSRSGISALICPELVHTIRSQYRLDWWGIHGITHWARVWETGLRLAVRTDANPRVVELFAVFHDACRANDGRDPDHGRRAAELVERLQGQLFELSETERALLRFACVHHARGWTEADVTVQTCWDADRLDLGRVGIIPSPSRLCTAPAGILPHLPGRIRGVVGPFLPERSIRCSSRADNLSCLALVPRHKPVHD